MLTHKAIVHTQRIATNYKLFCKTSRSQQSTDSNSWG